MCASSGTFHREPFNSMTRLNASKSNDFESNAVTLNQFNSIKRCQIKHSNAVKYKKIERCQMKRFQLTTHHRTSTSRRRLRKESTDTTGIPQNQTSNPKNQPNLKKEALEKGIHGHDRHPYNPNLEPKTPGPAWCLVLSVEC